MSARATRLCGNAVIWQTVSQLWEVAMPRFIEGKNRRKTLLLPECLDDHVTQDNPVRVIDAFIDELDLQALGLTRAQPAGTGRPSDHPAILLKIYLYGYLH
jgi:transposase